MVPQLNRQDNRVCEVEHEIENLQILHKLLFNGFISNNRDLKNHSFRYNKILFKNHNLKFRCLWYNNGISKNYKEYVWRNRQLNLQLQTVQLQVEKQFSGWNLKYNKCRIINIMLNRISKTTNPPFFGPSFQESTLSLYVRFQKVLSENRTEFLFRTIAHE